MTQKKGGLYQSANKITFFPLTQTVSQLIQMILDYI